MFHLVPISLFVVLASSVGASADVNDCVKRTPANVTLRDLDGDWYIKAMINDTDVNEWRQCIKVSYKYNEANDTSRESGSSIPHGEKDVVNIHVDFTMKNGVVENSVTDSTGAVLTVHAVVTHIVKDEYAIISLCRKKNGIKSDDRLALYTRDRNMGHIRMHQILRSIGVRGDEHSYFYPRQTNCPN